MTRPTQARIDLAALQDNYRCARRLHGGRALAVIKANAYGHGALQCARALASIADGFAVAFLDEAVALREGGVRGPILVLEGAFSTNEVRLASRLSLWLTVHHDEQIRMLAESSVAPHSLGIWLKLDSGMRRAGFSLQDARGAHERMQRTGKVSSSVLMTHFACADEPQRDDTRQQIERFDAATRDLPGERSLCNSAGLISWPSARRDWARPGLMLYGVAPAGTVQSQLQPVMTFGSTVFAERTLLAGEAVGYGASFIAPRRMRIGLVCAGYADGYPQTAPSGTPVAVDRQRTALIGRVSMDMLAVDLTELPSAGIGSEVELWGRTIRVAEVAAASSRIAYELLCNVKRAGIVYAGTHVQDLNGAMSIDACTS